MWAIDIEAEIRNSVLAALEGTTHERILNYRGRIGEGYIISDPEFGRTAELHS